MLVEAVASEELCKMDEKVDDLRSLFKVSSKSHVLSSLAGEYEADMNPPLN